MGKQHYFNSFIDKGDRQKKARHHEHNTSKMPRWGKVKQSRAGRHYNKSGEERFIEKVKLFGQRAKKF